LAAGVRLYRNPPKLPPGRCNVNKHAIRAGS
jgi:hypothetical protein